MNADSFYEDAKACAAAFFYSFLFFSSLSVVVMFVLVPVASLIRHGHALFPISDLATAYKLIKIILACSLVVSIAIISWAGWETWKERKVGKL